MNDPVDVLAQLTKAGGLVGISNNKWWLDLAIAHGPACVLAIVDEIHADTRQAVSVATVAKRCEKEAKQKQDEADDAAEDAAMARQRARAPTVHVHPTGSEVTAAAVVSEPASVAAAIDAHSIQPAEPAPNQEISMATIKQLVKSIEEEIARRDIAIKDAMREIGVPQTSIYNWRKGICSDRMQQRLTTWLPESAKQPAAGDVSQAKTVELEKEPRSRTTTASGVTFAGLEGVKILGSEQHKKHRTPPASEASPAMDLSDLLTQGANLRDALNALGSTGYADIVQQFVDRLTTMRAALGG